MPLSAVVVYEDLETGKHAKRMCDFLVRNLGEDCRFVSQMWKFEMLAVPAFREMAAGDAALADLIFVSSHGLGDLPMDVKAWVELWLGTPTSAFALVALFDRPNENTNEVQAVQDYLGTVARRGGMEFFAQPDVWPDSPVTTRRVVRNGLAATDVAAVPTRNASVGHWGLNE